MDKRFGISVFPPPMPRTPAGKFLLLYDLTMPIVDAETGETYPPILTPEEGMKLLEAPMSDDHMNQRAQNTANSAEAMRQHAYVDPNVGIPGLLKREREQENEACAVLAESHGFPELARYIRMRVSTSATPKDPDPT